MHTGTEIAQTLAETLSYLHEPRPFKDPSYVKNANRRTKNLKTVLTQERERERVEREKRRAEKEAQMDVDVEEDGVEKREPLRSSPTDEEEVPTCELIVFP